MRCRHVERKLTPYLDGRLDQAEREQLESHLADCASCKETHDLLAAASTALAAQGAAEPPDDLVQRSVRAAFTAEDRHPALLGGLSELLRWPALATATAAAVLAVALTLSAPVPSPSAPSADDAVAALMADDEVALDPAAEVAELLAQEER